eukprot:gene19552-21484_t
MRGDADVIIHDIDENPKKATLTDALYIPSYPQDIFSVQAATERGTSIIFQPDHAELKYKDGTEFSIEKDGRLYYLKAYDEKSESDTVNYTQDIKERHEILGHCNYDDIIKLEKVVDGMKVTGKESVKSGAVAVYFFKNKSDAVKATEKFIANIAPYGTVKCIRSDGGGEFISKEFESLLTKNGIRHDKSSPHSPHQNGTAERHWRTLFEMGRCLLTQENVSKEFWPYAVMGAAHIRNRCYNKRLQKTPYQAMTGKKPNLSNMRTFGSECFAYKQKRSKLDDRCAKGIFLGYDKSSPSYLVFIPDTNKVMKYRVVKFPTKKAIEQQTQTEKVFSDFEESILCQRQVIKDPNPGTARATNVDESQGVFNEETERSTNETSTESIDSQVPPRNKYPKRERRPPIRLGDYVNGKEIESNQVMNTIDYCYRVSAFPQKYQEAMQSPDSDNWKVAMNDEMNSLLANGTFCLTTLPQAVLQVIRFPVASFAT